MSTFVIRNEVWSKRHVEIFSLKICLILRVDSVKADETNQGIGKTIGSLPISSLSLSQIIEILSPSINAKRS